MARNIAKATKKRVEYGGDGGTGSMVANIDQIADTIHFLAQKDIETVQNSKFTIRTGIVAFNPENLVRELKPDLRTDEINAQVANIIPEIAEIAEIYSNLLQGTGKDSGTSEKAKFVINYELSNRYNFSDAKPFATPGVVGVNKQRPKVFTQSHPKNTSFGNPLINLVVCHSSEKIVQFNRLQDNLKRLQDLKTSNS